MPPTDGGPVRLLMLNRVSFMGGVERIIVTAMDLLAERGFEPLLACPGEGELPDAVRARGFEVVPCDFDRMRGTVDPRDLWRYAVALRRERARVLDVVRARGIDLLHAHHPVAGLYGTRAVREIGVPMAMHVHETPPLKPLYAMAMRRAARHVRRFVCVSGASRALLRELRIPDDRAEVVYNGVHPGFLEAPPAPAADVTGPGPHVGIFGVLEPRKAQHVFLEAAARLATEFPTAHFWVVGAVAFTDDEPYRARLEAMAAQPPLAGRVTFTGHRRDVARLMMAMDAIALSSVAFDALPTVIIESLTLGRLVAASRVGGVPEIIRDEETGLIVPPGDPAALAGALSRLLRDGRASGMGPAAARDMRARFSPGRFGDDLAAALRRALEPAHDVAAAGGTAA
jgi:glycosyltransferase involved in cell wall biosynthesis